MIVKQMQKYQKKINDKKFNYFFSFVIQILYICTYTNMLGRGHFGPAVQHMLCTFRHAPNFLTDWLNETTLDSPTISLGNNTTSALKFLSVIEIFPCSIILWEQQQSKGAKEDSGTFWLFGTLWWAGIFWVAGASFYVFIYLLYP